jgi:hypothetical protein
MSYSRMQKPMDFWRKIYAQQLLFLSLDPCIIRCKILTRWSTAFLCGQAWIAQKKETFGGCAIYK